jgi:hypothetical protein
VGPGNLHEVLLLASELTSGGLWRYTYSTAPGVRVTIVVPVAVAMTDPADSVYASIVTALTGGQP